MAVDTLAEQHLRRYDALRAQLSLWLPTWQELAEFFMPRRANVHLGRSPGQPQTERLYDSTGVHANELLAASMQGSLTSAAVKWFYYRVRGLEYGKETEIDQWLEEAGTISYDEIRDSNFSAEAHSFYADLSCFGTAAMFVDRKEPLVGRPWAGLRFKTLPPGTYCVDEDAEGRVDTLYYQTTLTARQAAQQFGTKVLPDVIVAQLRDGANPDTPFSFIHAVVPRRDPWIAREKKILAPKDRPWASVWISVEGRKVVREHGYYEFPFMVARWAKSSGEVYGRGPGYTALPDAKTLNKLVELKLRALANMVYPPLKQRDEGVTGKVVLAPGGITHVRDMDAVQPLQLAGRLDLGTLQEDKLQQAIRRVFFSDQLQLQEGPQMTAYEVQVRYELMQRILGPTLGRLETEFLEPLITRVFNLLDRAGRIPPPPPALAEVLGSRPLEIQYEGPLQRAQRLGDVVTIQRFFQLAIPLAQLDPTIMDNFDLDSTARVLAESTGVPARIIRDESVRDEIRQQRSAAQAQQAEAAQMQETIKAVGAGAPALKALVEAQKAGILPQGGLTGRGVPTPGVGQ